MNLKKLLIATAASFVVGFALGGFIHMVLLKSWYQAHLGMAGNVERAQPMMLYIALGSLLISFTMSYLYPKGVESDNKIMEGLKFGVIMGLFWIVPHNLILYGATTLLSGKFLLMDAAVNGLSGGITGIVIALVYGNEPFLARKK
jgi:hypothetical protein